MIATQEVYKWKARLNIDGLKQTNGTPSINYEKGMHIFILDCRNRGYIINTLNICFRP